MGTLPFVFCIYCSHYSHTAWQKPIFIENCCSCKRIKPKIICNPDLMFGLAEHIVTLTLYTALPLYHIEEMCHPDLIFWPILLFGTWKDTCVYFKISFNINHFKSCFVEHMSLSKNGRDDLDRYHGSFRVTLITEYPKACFITMLMSSSHRAILAVSINIVVPLTSTMTLHLNPLCLILSYLFIYFLFFLLIDISSENIT